MGLYSIIECSGGVAPGYVDDGRWPIDSTASGLGKLNISISLPPLERPQSNSIAGLSSSKSPFCKRNQDRTSATPFHRLGPVAFRA